MATPGKGKKSKKTKGRTIDLMDFLNSGKKDGYSVVTSVVTGDDYGDGESAKVTTKTFVLPTEAKSLRNDAASLDDVPNSPPYTAQLRNLPYTFTEERLRSFLDRYKIDHMTMPKDMDTGSCRGYAFVEFAFREDLISVLSMPSEDLEIENRTIKVSVAAFAGKGGSYSSSARQQRGGVDGGDGDSAGGRGDSTSDWRSVPRPMTSSAPRRESGGGFRSYGSGGGGPGGQSSRMDGFDRSQMRSDVDRTERVRPKFELSKRTVPLEEGNKNTPSQSNQSSIFGSARPVDTKKIEDKILAKKEEPVVPEKPSTHKPSVFGEAKPVDTLSREQKILESRAAKVSDVAEQGESGCKKDGDSIRDLRVSDEKDDTQRVTTRHISNVRSSSIFGDAKPVDTASREDIITKKNTYLPPSQRHRAHNADTNRVGNRHKDNTETSNMSTTNTSDNKEQVCGVTNKFSLLMNEEGEEDDVSSSSENNSESEEAGHRGPQVDLKFQDHLQMDKVRTISNSSNGGIVA